MPLYEYCCKKTGRVFEVMQKFSDEPLTNCGGRIETECCGQLERLISPPALQFKGTGWYITDYARGNSGAAKSSGESGSASSGSESKTESKSESKPKTPASSDK